MTMEPGPIQSPEDAGVRLPEAPPTEPMPLGAVRLPSTWPMVLGVLGCVMGVGGVITGLWTMASPLFIDAASRFVPNGQQTMAEPMKGWTVWFVVSGLVTIVLAAVLLMSAIGLIRHRRYGPRWAFRWACVKIPWGILATVIGIVLQMDQMEATQAQIAQNPGAGPGAMMMTQQVMPAIMIFFGVLTVLWYALLPVAMLVVLTRPSVRTEIDGWS